MYEQEGFDSEVINNLSDIKVTTETEGGWVSYRFLGSINLKTPLEDVIGMLCVGADIFVTIAGVKKRLKLENV